MFPSEMVILMATYTGHWLDVASELQFSGINFMFGDFYGRIEWKRLPNCEIA